MKRRIKLKKNSTLARVPREVQRILEMKMPNMDSASRWQMVYNCSAVRLDNWLGSKPNKRK